MASNKAASDPGSARKLGQASIGVSVAGIVVTVVLIIIIVAVNVGAAATYCAYTYNGVCYRYRDYVSSYDICIGKRVGNYCYHD